MAENLTPQQRQAVEHRGGKLLVSAAAGSGKTKVLVDRLMGYLTDPVDPANIDDFLMITYTKAAASELRGKIAAKLSERIAQNPENRHLQQQLQRLYLTKISTVHAFCGDILREYAYKLDIAGDFRVADENECREIRTQVLDRVLGEAYDRAGEDPDFCAFVDTQGLGRDDRGLADLVLSVYDSARCHLQPQLWLERCMELSDTQALADAAQSPFGRFLMDRFFAWLDLQISAMEQCAGLASQAEGFEKPAALLWDTVYQLKKLRESQTWDQICERKGIDFGTLRFPKNCSDPTLADNIKMLRENCKKGLARYTKPFADPSEQILGDMAGVKPAIRGLVSLTRKFDREFTRAKKSRQVLDFGDLEHKMLDLLLGSSRSGPTAAAAEVGRRFREVMVDEYQDSNQVQDAIYSALTARKNNLFLVGDVKQSIYQFRLADPQIFLDKYAAFAPVGEDNESGGSKVLLSKNFRSSGGVLAAANDVFRLCMCPEVGGLYYGAEEALYEGFDHGSLGEPDTELYCIQVEDSTYPEEAAFVASRIRELLDGDHFIRTSDGQLRKILPEDIAILLRSPGSTGKYFQKALEKVGIRCATGGGVDLLQTQEIATVRSVLQAIHNPMQDIPLIAAMASPIFGFTAQDLARIRSRDRNCAFYDCLRQDTDPKSTAFVQTLLELRQELKVKSLTGLVEALILKTDLDGIYGAMDDGPMRSANLQTFLQLIAGFCAGGSADLGRFLEHLDAMEEKGLMTAGEQTSPGCVTIMSIHKSKGLEFPVVFLSNLSKAFNMESQRAKVLCHKTFGLGLSAADPAKRIYYPTLAKRAIGAKMGMDAVSEEMRVLYVAMTRAKDRLIMTYASDSLEKDLAQTVSRLNMGGKQLLIQEASCCGDWVLLSALHRTEAGELFALGGKPRETTVGAYPWSIHVVQAGEEGLRACSEEEGHAAVGACLEALKENLCFVYPYAAATRAPSKQTATQKKGRPKDQEAAENAQPEKLSHRSFRKPSFRETEGLGKEYGTAMHAALQFISYEACTGVEGVEKEIRRLTLQHFLTSQQASLIRPHKIARLFATDLGRKLLQGQNIEREFKFSILEDAREYDPALSGEQVLLQGVVDCALLEEDGITVIDFKTDYVTEETLPEILDRYRPQVMAYSQAMERIFRKKVKKTVLYFFALDRFVDV